MPRRPLIAGNWKLNPATVQDATALATAISEGLPTGSTAEVLVIPPTAFVGPVGAALSGDVILGGQNSHPAQKGAFTGEATATMLSSLGCRYVLCGHSERRAIFGESPEFVGEKVVATLAGGLSPILCVGETQLDREAGRTNDVVSAQLAAGLAGVLAAGSLVIAYEPVWAIGTGLTATPEQAEAIHLFIRDWVADRFDPDTAEAMRIQYGGSVKPGNALELLSQPNIDGALVGGASLKAESFLAIIACATPS